MVGPDPPKDPIPEAHAGASDRLVSAMTMALLVFLGGGGAAMGPDGARFGLPTPLVILAGLTAAAFVWVLGARGLGGLLMPLIAGLVGAVIGAPSLLLFTGSSLFALAFAGVCLAVSGRNLAPPRWLLVPAFFALYASVAYLAQTRVGPDGDEPQYLMVAESLLRDGDLELGPDFQEGRYRAFFGRELEPHFRVRGPEGQIYSLHAVGLSILILPAYALGGYAGASFFMAFLAALLVREVRRLLVAVSGEERASEGLAWLVGLSPPIIHFAGLIFTEIPAALLLCTGLRSAMSGRAPRAFSVAALCAAALPWFNVRYAILSLAILVAMVGRLRAEGNRPTTWRTLTTPALVLAASAFALGLYHFELWGFFDPRRVYGRRREFSLDILPEGLPGIFFDQEFGLLVYAPIFALSLAGIGPLWRRQRTFVISAGVAVCGVIAVASVWPMWRGGFNPPARFLVPLIPLFAAALAVIPARMRAGTALLTGWGLWCGLFGAANIETIHRDRDGVAPFFRLESGAREWTSVLPSFVLSEDRPTRVLMWPWLALLALPVVGALRSRSGAPWPNQRHVALGCLALVATAAVADRMSPRARNAERDASRLLGRPSIALPGFKFSTATEVGWPLDLLHDPRRNPNGSVFGRGVRLPSGRYEVTLMSEDGASEGVPLLVATDHRTRRSHAVSLRLVSNLFSATLVIDAAGDYDLSLTGGAPTAISFVRIAPLR